MKFFAVFALVVAAAMAVPVEVEEKPAEEVKVLRYDNYNLSEKEATILRYENDNIGLGDYRYAFETSDGKVVSEQGTLKNVGTDNVIPEVRGQFSYIDKSGIPITVTYVANELGFQPIGDHIPKA